MRNFNDSMGNNNYEKFCARIEDIPGRLSSYEIIPTHAEVVFEKEDENIKVGYFIYKGREVVAKSGFSVGSMSQDEKIGSGLNIGYFVYEGENIVVTSGFGVGQLNKDKEIEKYLAEHKSQFIEVMSGILNKRKISLLEGKVDIWKNSKVGAS